MTAISKTYKKEKKAQKPTLALSPFSLSISGMKSRKILLRYLAGMKLISDSKLAISHFIHLSKCERKSEDMIVIEKDTTNLETHHKAAIIKTGWC